MFALYQKTDIILHYQLQEDNTVHPGSYTLLLNPIDDVDNIGINISAQVVEQRDNTLVLSTTSLPWERLWRCAITPQACPVQASLSTKELSKYMDVYL